MIGIRPVNSAIVRYEHIHIHAYTTSVIIFTECLVSGVLGNGEEIKYHIFISVVVTELSVRSFKYSA